MAKRDDLDPAQHWIKQIAVYEREFKRWEGRTEKILKRYRDDARNNGSGASAKARFNILWSNVQTAVPAVFSRLPQPDVSRRHKDTDPVGRVAALILERALEFEVQHYPDYAAAMKNCVMDRFLGGRGVAWVRYEPHTKAVQAGMSDDGYQVTEDADDESQQVLQEELEYECAPTDYVHWRDFGHTQARTWEEVTAVWRRVYMGREALIERFGEEAGAKVPLDTKPQELKDKGGDGDYQAVIYEIWDKPSGSAIWLSKSLGKVLDEKPDPLGLENFFPCPRPLYATLTSDSLVPVPDYALYQDQAATLDVLADRIDGLVRAMQVKGVYDASIPEIGRIFTDANDSNALVAVKNWVAFAEKQGLKGAIDLVDLTPIFNALQAAYAAVEEQKRQIYEITGLADIIRGSTDPNETATAQRMKGQFGSMRLRAMQNEVARFACELLQIKAQIICRQFEPQTLVQIGAVQALSPADQQLVPQALQLLKNATLRDFRIEVTADSMIHMDEQQEKQDRMEFLQAVSTFMSKAVSVPPELAPLAVEMLKFGVTGFKVGKSLEGTIDQELDRMREANKQPKPPKQDPEIEKIKMQAQIEMQKLQLQDKLHERQLQMDAQLEQAKQSAQAQQNQHQQGLESQRAEQQAQIDAQLKAHEATIKAQAEAQKADFERWKAQLDAETRVTVAQIAAQASAKKRPDVVMGNEAPAPEASQPLADAVTAALMGFQDSIGRLMQENSRGMQEALGRVIEAQSRPKTVIRGADGKVVGVQ